MAHVGANHLKVLITADSQVCCRGGGYSSIKAGVSIDLGAYSYDGKSLLRYLRGNIRID